MLIVHALSILLSVPLRLLLIKPICALGLGQFVYFRSGESGEELFGKGMCYWLP